MQIYQAKDGQLAEHLFESDTQTVTHLQIKAGKSVPRHKSPNYVVVVIYKGKVIFSTDDDKVELCPGTIVRMVPDEYHSLQALEDSDLMVVKSKLKE